MNLAGDFHLDIGPPVQESLLPKYPWLADSRNFHLSYLSPLEVPRAMLDLIIWHQRECRSSLKFGDILHASQFYLQFLWISPFVGGNQTIAQILMATILDYRGFPPVLFTNRRRYNNALIGAFHGQSEPFYNMVLDQIETELDPA